MIAQAGYRRIWLGWEEIANPSVAFKTASSHHPSGAVTYLGLRGSGGLLTAYVVAAVLLVALYPMCRWYRSYKDAHRDGWLPYF